MNHRIHGRHEKKRKGLVPKLRFPEFRGEGEWEEIRLTDTANKKKKWSFVGGPFGSNLKSTDYTDNGVRIIQLQNIGDSEFIDDYKIFTSEEKANELSNCNIYPGEIILSKMGDPVGRACLIPNYHQRYVMCSDGIRLIVNENFYSKYFIYSLINSVQFRSTIENNSTGSTRKRIGLDVLRNLPLAVPQRQEQQKIADCLTSLDKLITAEAGKLEAYKAHKKGLMQKLFPAEGKTIPEWRFPEFRGEGEWEEETLEKEAAIVMGASPKSEFYNEENNGLPLLQGNADIRNRVSTPRVFTSQITKECQKGDILLSVRAPVGTIAKSIHHACIGRGIAAIRANKDNSQEFLYQSLFAFESQWQNISQGGTFDAVNSDDIRQLATGFPSKPEQQKIADCLTSLDELITAQAKKIDTLKSHKKGLMQGLFPCSDEVDYEPRKTRKARKKEKGVEPQNTRKALEKRKGLNHGIHGRELLSIVVDEKISNPSFFSRGLFLEDSIFTKHTLNNPGDQLVST